MYRIPLYIFYVYTRCHEMREFSPDWYFCCWCLGNLAILLTHSLCDTEMGLSDPQPYFSFPPAKIYLFIWKADLWREKGGTEKDFSICWFTPQMPQWLGLSHTKAISLMWVQRLKYLAIFGHLPLCLSRDLDQKWNIWDIGTKMGCQHCRLWFDLLLHNAGPARIF